MEPIRFADILFTLLATGLTLGILAFVNRKRPSEKKKTPETVEKSQETGSEDKIQTSDEDI